MCEDLIASLDPTPPLDLKIPHKIEHMSLFDLALTHSSISKMNYQKLEFLGDAVHRYFILHYVYENPHA